MQEVHSESGSNNGEKHFETRKYERTLEYRPLFLLSLSFFLSFFFFFFFFFFLVSLGVHVVNTCEDIIWIHICIKAHTQNDH